MARLTITPHLRRFFPALAEGEAEVAGATVREIVDALERRYPGFASYVVDEAGRLRRHVNVFVGDEPIGDRVGLSDVVGPDAHVSILQALSGG
jgi:molybdopterin synthase sulfur carrier subunit